MKHVYRLDNLRCAACAAKMEAAINKIDGVVSAKVVFMTARLTIESDGSDMSVIERKAQEAARKIESEVRLKKV